MTTSPTTDKPKDKLPNTGANVGNMAIAGVILLLGGTALFVRSRKES
ncbi:LPXTG cell wall anchor domain-containing protein [Changpingibacter yushuensis]